MTDFNQHRKYDSGEPTAAPRFSRIIPIAEFHAMGVDELRAIGVNVAAVADLRRAIAKAAACESKVKESA